MTVTHELLSMARQVAKGPLPQGWRWVRLGHVGRFESGGTPSKTDPAFWGGHIPFVTGADITGYLISRSHARAFLTNAGLASGHTAVCLPGTVLLVTRTRVGRVGIATETLAASQDLTPFVCGPAVLPEYVCWYLRGLSNYLLANCRGSTIQGLTRDFIQGLELPLAPLVDQKRIAAALTDQMAAVDRARAAAEAQLAAAEELPAAYLGAVFGSDEAGEWPRQRVADLCTDIAYGFTASADFAARGPRFLRITDIQNGEVDWNRVPGCRIAATEESRNSLTDGDIVFARTGGTTGKSFLVKRPPRAVFASYLIRLRPNAETVPEYLYAFFQSDDYWKQIRASVRGGAQPNVNATLLGNIVLPVAPLPEQGRMVATFDSQMTAVRRLLEALRSQRVSLVALPAALLSYAFSGRL